MKGDGPIEISVATSGTTHPDKLEGQGGAGEFLPKGRGGYRGIGLVEVVWKVCVAVINCRLKKSVTLHDELYGFRAGRVTGTATLEEKLAQ